MLPLSAQYNPISRHSHLKARLLLMKVLPIEELKAWKRLAELIRLPAKLT
jgi:hypothetical protein